jgi:hypothetical protein
MSKGPNAHDYKPTLDALSANIAVVGLNGNIVMVNRAWRDFAEKNGALAETVSEGVNYLQVCDQSSGDYSKEAKSFASGIRMVLSGEKKAYMRGYPCHSPSQRGGSWKCRTISNAGQTSSPGSPRQYHQT